MARGQVRDARERGKRMSNVGRRRLVRVFMVGDSEDAGTMILRFSSLCRRRRPRPRFLAVDFSKLRSMSSWLPTCRVPHRHQVECMPREIRVTRETHETTISRPTHRPLSSYSPGYSAPKVHAIRSFLVAFPTFARRPRKSKKSRLT